MGRKSASKVQARTPSAAPPPRQPDGASTPWLIVAIVALIAVGGAFAYVRSNRVVEPETAAVAQPDPSTAAASEANTEPPAAKFGPHEQTNFPPLPFSGTPMLRPPDVVNAAYHFAAEHPEVLSYVPCYCGCERMGHRGNDDCFVTTRAPNGDVTGWEPHGMTWEVCLDVARDAMQMHASGASVRDIRAANEKKWTPSFPNHTPTPRPAAGK